MAYEFDTLEALFEALNEAIGDIKPNRESMIENLSVAVGIMMMRSGVNEMSFHEDELVAFTKKYLGMGLSCEVKDTNFIVRICQQGDTLAQGAHLLN